MQRIKHLPIVVKIMLLLGGFGILAVGSVIMSTSEMRHIDDSYGDAIDRQGFAAIYLSQAERAMQQSRAAISDLEIAATPDGNRQATEELKQSRASFADLMTKARTADSAEAVAIDSLSVRGIDILDRICAKSIRLGEDENLSPTLAQEEYLKDCSPAFESFGRELKASAESAKASIAALNDALTPETDRTIIETYIVVLGGLLVALAGAYYVVTTLISRPIKDLATTMETIAHGNFEVLVPGAERRDEIGPMARAVQVFKDNGIKLALSEAETDRHRRTAEQERSSNEATRMEVQREQQAVMATLAAGLERLANGDLTGRLNDRFAQEYEKLRSDFNATAESLQGTLRTIVVATDGIRAGSTEIAHASDDLAKRTEQQAANLEETAAALDQITITVKRMAAGAGEAAGMVAATRDDAKTSGTIVGEAIDAMSKIKVSSYEISQIISVIDEIAFQTNLLALNAGVEAARAGEAGRGFAVVASEVRSLAQRSASSAKEIKALISTSANHVESGVMLVGKTGSTLTAIIEKIGVIDTLVREISVSSQEQASSLAEINIAVTQMDQIVQQNAAMVEESTAAAHSLRQDTENLTTMVGNFEIGDKGFEDPTIRPHASVPKHTSSSRPRPMLRTISAATRAAPSPANDWEEF